MRTNFKIRNLIAIAVLLSVAGAVSAQDTIAVVNQERVLFASEAAEEASLSLRDEFRGQEERVQALEQEINQLRERAQTDSALMTEEETAELQQEMRSLLGEREQLVNQLQSAQQERRQAFVEEYGSVVTGILQDLVDENGIDLLISSSEVLYARPDMDLTDEALSRFNEQTGSGENGS